MSYLRPTEVRQMRFNQLRSKNLVIAPWNIAQAEQETLDNEPLPSMYLPASMGQNKWKTPPLGYDRSYGASARAVGELAHDFGEPAPIGLMQPVPFYTEELAVRDLNHLPRMRKELSVTEPLSRGVLQRGDLDFTNAEEVHAVARARQDPTQAYDTQFNIAARMFPSNYEFKPYTGPRYVTPGRGVSGLGSTSSKGGTVVAVVGGVALVGLFVYIMKG